VLCIFIFLFVHLGLLNEQRNQPSRIEPIPTTTAPSPKAQTMSAVTYLRTEDASVPLLMGRESDCRFILLGVPVAVVLAGNGIDRVVVGSVAGVWNAR
jgi:hypothetical protein